MGSGRRTRIVVVVASILVAFLGLTVARCGSDARATFDPTGPCAVDGQRPGAYPDLEATIPRSFDGRAPDHLDSGRHCSEASLGTLVSHGIRELRFAGGLWETGTRSGVTLARFSAPGLDARQLAEFYEAGARAGRKTENVRLYEVPIGGAVGQRIDTLNDDSYQSIVVWDGDAPGTVLAVLVGSSVREVASKAAHEDVLNRAVAALLG